MTIRIIDVRERVMARNDELASEVRDRLRRHRVTALNLVSSPGSGKTTLLERTLERIGDELTVALVAGDVQTQNDAERLAQHTDRLVHAVVTNGACHLDAMQILTALDQIDLDAVDLLFIENVGNLVCPASWDLGEAEKIVLFSVTEGEDKPLKYPKMFREAGAAVITKVDLLPYVDFDVATATEHLRQINPRLDIVLTSSQSGDGLEGWCDLLASRVRKVLVG